MIQLCKIFMERKQRSKTPIHSDESNKYTFKMNIQGKNKTDYTLFDMLVHIGSALGGGHCIAYVMVNSHWFEMNDKQVYKYIN